MGNVYAIFKADQKKIHKHIEMEKNLSCAFTWKKI